MRSKRPIVAISLAGVTVFAVLASGCTPRYWVDVTNDCPMPLDVGLSPADGSYESAYAVVADGASVRLGYPPGQVEQLLFWRQEFGEWPSTGLDLSDDLQRAGGSPVTIAIEGEMCDPAPNPTPSNA